MEAIITKVIEVPVTEGWMNDENLSKYSGKSYEQTQFILREMWRDPVGRQYISKHRGRSTCYKAFIAYIQYRDRVKYGRSDEKFSYKGERI